MWLKRLSVLSVAVSFLAVSQLLALEPGPVDRPPNILLITIDTLRADHLSCYGYHLKTSPRIDRFASEGLRFQRAYAVIPLTGPSHFTLFTSRYPQETGVRINGVTLAEHSRWLLLPQILKSHGYRSAAYVSAWPLTDRLTHLGRFFDVYDEELTRTYQLFNSSRYAEDVTPRALKWLTQARSEPFFLWVHYFDPHSPYHLREEFASPTSNGHKPAREESNTDIRKRIKEYDSEIGYTDSYVGQLLDALDNSGLRDSTLVVLASDHGESLGEHEYVGHGRRLDDAILRVPLIMRYPPKIASGKTINERVSLLDVTPTVLDLTLGNQSTDTLRGSFAGLSLAGAVAGKGSIPQRTLRSLTFGGKKGLAPGWLSWLWVDQDDLPLRLAKYDGGLKWIWSPPESQLSIVNIARDPFELAPQVVSSGGSYEETTSEMKEWFATTQRAESEITKSKRDERVLRSLGYIQ